MTRDNVQSSMVLLILSLLILPRSVIRAEEDESCIHLYSKAGAKSGRESGIGLRNSAFRPILKEWDALEVRKPNGKRTSSRPILFESATGPHYVIHRDRQQEEDETLLRILDSKSMKAIHEPVRVDESGPARAFFFKGKRHLAFPGTPFTVLDIESGRVEIEDYGLKLRPHLTLLPEQEKGKIVTYESDSKAGVLKFIDPSTFKTLGSWKSRELRQKEFSGPLLVEGSRKDEVLIISEGQLLKADLKKRKVRKIDLKAFEMGGFELSFQGKKPSFVAPSFHLNKKGFPEIRIVDLDSEKQRTLVVPLKDRYIREFQKLKTGSVPFASFLLKDPFMNVTHLGLVNLETGALQINEFRPEHQFTSYRLVDLAGGGNEYHFLFASSPGRATPLQLSLEGFAPAKVSDTQEMKKTNVIRFPGKKASNIPGEKKNPGEQTNLNGFGLGAFYSLDGRLLSTIELPEGNRSDPLFYMHPSWNKPNTMVMEYQGVAQDTVYRSEFKLEEEK